MPARRSSGLILAMSLLTGAGTAHGQIDPERRQLVQTGFNQAVDGRGPLAAYGYLYINEPHFFGERPTLRMVVAPGYIDSELGIAEALGPKTHLGLGLAGGAFADSHNEIRQNRYIRGESFRGDGVRSSVSLYHDFPAIGPVPMAGILRVEGHYAAFIREKTTAPAFVTPKPQGEIILRSGVRLGGMEPLLNAKLAMECSLWYESRFRLAPAAYGLNDDRRFEANTQLIRGRTFLVYNEPSSAERFIVVLSGGVSVRPDRFSAYRLGGDLPMASEFPLSLPGYYYEELSARSYSLLSGTYIVPLSRNKTMWTASVTAATAYVEYAPGSDQRGKSHTGVGVGAAYLSHTKTWQVLTAYGYGVNAARGHGNGGHTVGLLLQYDFQRLQLPFFHPATPRRGGQYMLRTNPTLTTPLKVKLK